MQELVNDDPHLVSALYVLAVGMTMMVTRRRHVCCVRVVGTRLLGGRIARSVRRAGRTWTAIRRLCV